MGEKRKETNDPWLADGEQSDLNADIEIDYLLNAISRRVFMGRETSALC